MASSGAPDEHALRIRDGLVVVLAPAGGPRMTLVVLASVAMGMQSSAVRRLGQMSSTYLTSTLTGVLEAFAVCRWPQDWQRNTGVLLALIIGAGLGAGADVIHGRG